MKSASLPDGFFLGQIPPNWNEYVRTLSWEDAHNNRVKVRIPGKHSKGNEICDKDLPWAIVEQSTSSGNLNGSSVALWGGEWVTGYFLDRDEQIPVITGVLGVNIDAKGKINKSACSTEFKPVNRFNSGLVAQAHQIIGGKARNQNGSANPSKEDFEKATQGMGKGSESDAELEAVAEAEGQSGDLFANPNAPNPEEATAEAPGDSGDGSAYIDATPETPQQAAAAAAASSKRMREKLTVDRALAKANGGGGTPIKNVPGGQKVNRTLTQSELQQFESKGYRFVPGSDGGGTIVAKDGQNYG